MRQIVRILQIEEWVSGGKKHSRTTARLDNQEDASGYGKDFKVGDLVEAWFDTKHGTYKMQKTKPKLDNMSGIK